MRLFLLPFLLACPSKLTDTAAVPEGQRCDFVSGLYYGPDDVTLSLSNPSDVETVFEGCAWDVTISGCDEDLTRPDVYAIVYPSDGWPEGVFTAVVSYHGSETFTTTCNINGRYDDGAGVTTVGELATFDVTVEE